MKLKYGCILLSFLLFSACAEDPIHLNMMPETPSKGKIRIALLPYTGLYGAKGDWPQSHGIYVKMQVETLNKVLADIGNYEIIDSKDIHSVFDNKLPDVLRLKRNDFQLTREVGKALSADYVLVAERGFVYTSRIYFSASLINVATGKIYNSSTDETTAFGGSVMMIKMIELAYRDIFRIAKDDVHAQSGRKKTQTAASTVLPSLGASPAPPAVLPVKTAQPEKAHHSAPPAIHILSPDISQGAVTTKTSKIAVTGKAATELGVSEVYVNGRNAGLAEDGSFTADIFLKIGVNDVTLVAIDTQGNKGTRTFKITRQPDMIAKTKIAPPVITLTAPDTERGVKVVSVSKIEVTGQATSEKGVAEVTINGQSAPVGENGEFSAEILLKVGENEVTVEALDTMGNKGTRTFKVQRQSQLMAKAKNESKPQFIPDRKYRALIIGNNNYKFLPKLETAKNDAIEIDKVLKEKYGFETRLLLDATRNDILAAINSFRKNLNENESFLVYYAGHGEFDKQADKAYWLPVDAQTDDDTNWIIADDLTTNLKRIPSRHILLVADSCYAGTLTRGFELDLKKGSRDEYIKKMQDRVSRSLIASGGNEPVADGGGGGHSVFADALLKALNTIDKNVFSAEELFYSNIKEKVAGKSNQVPEYGVIKNSGHEGGDFVFFKTGDQKLQR